MFTTTEFVIDFFSILINKEEKHNKIREKNQNMKKKKIQNIHDKISFFILF